MCRGGGGIACGCVAAAVAFVGVSVRRFFNPPNWIVGIFLEKNALRKRLLLAGKGFRRIPTCFFGFLILRIGCLKNHECCW